MQKCSFLDTLIFFLQLWLMRAYFPEFSLLESLNKLISYIAFFNTRLALGDMIFLLWKLYMLAYMKKNCSLLFFNFLNSGTLLKF